MHVTFYYVRHGQTKFNVVRRVQGTCDSPLTEQGIKDAEKARDALSSIHFDKAFSSSSERAVDTAAIVLEGHDIAAVPLKGLKEFDFGDLDGCLIDEVREQLDSHRHPDDFSDLGGDSTESINKRIYETFDYIISKCNDNDTVLIASHGSIGLHLLEALFGIDCDEYKEQQRQAHPERFAIPNGGIMKFEYTDGVWQVDCLPCEPDEYSE